jgi:2'-5' RNA ligase
MRLFIALELPAAVQTALQKIQQQIQRSGTHPVKWVRPEGMHLTLQFLGETEEQRVPAILDALEAVQVAHTQAMVSPLYLAAAGAFPHLKRPQTLWVGVDGDTRALSQMQQAVGQGMEPLGFAPETRPFRAHLTLGRVRKDAASRERAALGAAVAALPQPAAVNWSIGNPYLFESTLTPAGPIYRRISQ